MKYPPITTKQLSAIESQLSCPSGDKGVALGHTMHQSNIGMTLATIDALCIDEKDVVLEIGHGNCGHLKQIFAESEPAKYIGLEISKTMHEEAQKQLSAVDGATIEFKLYKGNTLPLESESINKIMTVNTVYFWKKPLSFFMEIARVLKKEGTCIVAFAEKSFMETLPFVNAKFRLYHLNDIEMLSKQAGMALRNTIYKKEMVKSKAGDLVERRYILAILIKVK